MIDKKSKIFVAGHRGLVGSSIIRRLKYLNYKNIYYQSSAKLDLRNQSKVYKYLKKIKPDAVIIAAAKVGGIHANNSLRAEFIFDNLSIQNNLIDGSYKNNVKNLVFLGSSCVYPKNSKQPIKEEYLLSNYLEKTNEPYAIAKIAGINMIESYNSQYNLNYKCLMPCNAYGPNDNYNLMFSHFLPALIKKITDAVRNNKDYIVLWGTGKPLRELIYCDDIADACLFFLRKKTKHSLINIGTGIEKSIEDYAKFIMKHLHVKLKIIYEKKNLDGTYRKLLDVSLAKKYGWKHKTTLTSGISYTLNDYLKKSFKKADF
ncbi:MAG: GDP-L-fucose synthase family protein [Candidatus Pelagibacter sp.]